MGKRIGLPNIVITTNDLKLEGEDMSGETLYRIETNIVLPANDRQEEEMTKLISDSAYVVGL